MKIQMTYICRDIRFI